MFFNQNAYKQTTFTNYMLKTDFHIHYGEDAHGEKYSAKDVIRFYAKQKFDAIALTNHNKITYDDELISYASSKGIVLIPGTELKVEGKHVLILNIEDNEKIKNTKTFQDLY